MEETQNGKPLTELELAQRRVVFLENVLLQIKGYIEVGEDAEASVRMIGQRLDGILRNKPGTTRCGILGETEEETPTTTMQPTAGAPGFELDLVVDKPCRIRLNMTALGAEAEDDGEF